MHIFRYPDFVDRSLRSLPWPFSDGSGIIDVARFLILMSPVAVASEAAP